MGSGDSFSCICRDGWEGRTCTHSELEGLQVGEACGFCLTSPSPTPIPSSNFQEEPLFHLPTSHIHTLRPALPLCNSVPVPYLQGPSTYPDPPLCRLGLLLRHRSHSNYSSHPMEASLGVLSLPRTSPLAVPGWYGQDSVYPRASDTEMCCRGVLGKSVLK